MADGRGPSRRGWLIDLVGWLSFVGLFATGITGLVGGAIRGGEPHLAGAAYLLVGALAFAAVLALVLRGPVD